MPDAALPFPTDGVPCAWCGHPFREGQVFGVRNAGEDGFRLFFNCALCDKLSRLYVGSFGEGGISLWRAEEAVTA